MRQLIKLDEPQVLQDNKEQWTEEYMQVKSQGKVPDSIKYRYRHRDIKDQLKNETHNKCIYCESKIGHNTPGDVEHIKPSSKNDNLHFDWNNMTIACAECNRRKSDYNDDEIPFLNPYSDEVEQMLISAGPLLFQEPGNKSAEITIKILELNDYDKRGELISRKIDRLKEIQNLVERWKEETNPKVKNILKKELENQCKKDKEYSLMLTQYIYNNVFVS